MRFKNISDSSISVVSRGRSVRVDSGSFVVLSYSDTLALGSKRSLLEIEEYTSDISLEFDLSKFTMSVLKAMILQVFNDKVKSSLNKADLITYINDSISHNTDKIMEINSYMGVLK